MLLLMYSCNNANNAKLDESNFQETNKIINYEKINITYVNAPLQDYPNGDILKIVDTETKCQIIEKGKKDTISEVIDYWYKIKYRGSVGWIFGAYTTKKLQKTTEYNTTYPYYNGTQVMGNSLLLTSRRMA